MLWKLRYLYSVMNHHTIRGQKKRTQYIIRQKCLSYRDTVYQKVKNFVDIYKLGLDLLIINCLDVPSLTYNYKCPTINLYHGGSDIEVIPDVK